MQTTTLCPRLTANKRVTVNPDPVPSSAISDAALKVFSPDEIKRLPHQMRLSLAGMLRRRLERPGPPPTLEELQGIKQLVTEELWHPSLSNASKLRED